MSFMSTILMEEGYWANSPLSVARYTGRIQVNGIVYVICNKEGKDIFECSFEAQIAGREKAIEPGEPADLCDQRYLPVYRKLGREWFIDLIKEHRDITPEEAFEYAGLQYGKSKKRTKRV